MTLSTSWEPDHLIHSVSHELNTALTTVLGNAHILRAKGEALDPASRSRALTDLEEHAERLFSAIQNLLLLARVEMGEEPFLEPALLSHVLNELVVQEYRRADGVIRTADLDVASPVAIDRNLFKVVLRNVIENASIYGPVGGTIEVRAREEAELAVVTVTDSGPGIPVAERHLVFEPFYRSPTITETVPGLGLGLTVARQLVQLHGGEMYVIDSPGSAGGAVEIRLPTIQA